MCLSEKQSMDWNLKIADYFGLKPDLNGDYFVILDFSTFMRFNSLYKALKAFKVILDSGMTVKFGNNVKSDNWNVNTSNLSSDWNFLQEEMELVKSDDKSEDLGNLIIAHASDLKIEVFTAMWRETNGELTFFSPKEQKDISKFRIEAESTFIWKSH